MSTPNPDENPVLRKRVGNLERDAVIERLQTAGAEGRLEVDELTERIETALQAKTFADLDPLVADLPGPPPSQTHGGAFAATQASALSTQPGSSPSVPMELRAAMEDERRRGRWTVPPFLRADPAMSTVELNFLEAVTQHTVITLEVRKGMGATVVVVPEGWGVNVDELDKTWGSVRNRVGSEPVPGKPLIRVTGNVGWSTFTARHANWFDQRRIGRNGG